MKKEWIVAFAAACAIALAGCKVVSEPEPIAVQSVTLNALSTLTLKPGETRKLSATVKPDNADDKTVKWSSSDTSVAMVDSNGNVKAGKAGKATITAQAGGKEAKCVITVEAATVTQPPVKPEPVAVESVTLSAKTLTIEPGKTRTLVAAVNPSNADDKTVAWSSSNADVATVDDDGTVTAHTEGTAVITAQASGKTAECTVSVKRILIAVNNVTLDTTTLTLTRDEKGKLSAKVTPDNADDPSVAWSSSDPAVATVDNDGTVTANNAGTATITAQAGEITAECAVTVNPILVASVSLDKATLTLMRGETGKLTATVTPSNADDPSVAWSSSDTSIAKVGDDGTITAVSKGTATITAQVGGKEATCAITVNPILVENIMLDKETLTLTYGEKGKLTATVIPDNADDKTVKWSSSDETIATVDNNGTVTVVKAGKVTVTAKADGKEAICAITVCFHFYQKKICKYCENVLYMEGGMIDDDGVLTRYSGSETSVIIPYGVKSISSYAFSLHTNITSVTIPSGVTSIGDRAFYGCTSLTSVTIPKSVTSIGNNAFWECASLTTVQYGSTMKDWNNISMSGGGAASGLSRKTIIGKDEDGYEKSWQVVYAD